MSSAVWKLGSRYGVIYVDNRDMAKLIVEGAGDNPSASLEMAAYFRSGKRVAWQFCFPLALWEKVCKLAGVAAPSRSDAQRTEPKREKMRAEAPVVKRTCAEATSGHTVVVPKEGARLAAAPPRGTAAPIEKGAVRRMAVKGTAVTGGAPQPAALPRAAIRTAAPASAVREAAAGRPSAAVHEASGGDIGNKTASQKAARGRAPLPGTAPSRAPSPTLFPELEPARATAKLRAASPRDRSSQPPSAPQKSPREPQAAVKTAGKAKGKEALQRAESVPGQDARPAVRAGGSVSSGSRGNLRKRLAPAVCASAADPVEAPKPVKNRSGLNAVTPRVKVNREPRKPGPGVDKKARLQPPAAAAVSDPNPPVPSAKLRPENRSRGRQPGAVVSARAADEASGSISQSGPAKSRTRPARAR